MDEQTRADRMELLRWIQVDRPDVQRCLQCGNPLVVVCETQYAGQRKPVRKWWPEYRRHLETCPADPDANDSGAAEMRATLLSKAGSIRARRSNGEPPKLRMPADRVQSRPKGANYENVIAKVFMKWYGGIWRRTPQSGGWMKGEGFDVPGDLVCTIPTTIHVECKNREGWDLTDLITGVRQRHSQSIVEWWLQTIRECPQGKMPFLVFRRNHLPDNMLMLQEEDFNKLDLNVGHATFVPQFRIWLELEKYSGLVAIVCLDHFVRKVRPPIGAPNHKTWQPRLLPAQE